MNPIPEMDESARLSPRVEPAHDERCQRTPTLCTPRAALVQRRQTTTVNAGGIGNVLPRDQAIFTILISRERSHPAPVTPEIDW